MSHQSHSISVLEETDKQIREGTCTEQLKRLKEARNLYREEVIDCVRHCAWYDEHIEIFFKFNFACIYGLFFIISTLIVVCN